MSLAPTPYSRYLRRRIRVLALIVLFAALPTWATDESDDQQALEPAAGMLLVAARGLEDPNFARTVVLLIQHTDSGTLGLVLNRPVPHTLADAVPELIPPNERTPFLFFGGPVGLNNLMFLFREKDKPDQALNVLEDTHLGLDRALLEEKLRTTSDYSRLRIFVGHAGWAPGQLAREIARGDWHVHSASEDTVWAPAAGDLWNQLIDDDESNRQLLVMRP